MISDDATIVGNHLTQIRFKTKLSYSGYYTGKYMSIFCCVPFKHITKSFIYITNLAMTRHAYVTALLLIIRKKLRPNYRVFELNAILIYT